MKRFYKYLSLFLTLCILVVSAFLSSVFHVFAGVSELNVFDSESLTDTTALSGSLWYYDKKDMSGTTVADNEIIFHPTDTDARFNLKRKINDLSDCGMDVNFELNGKFLLTEIPQGVRFVYAFGMDKVATYPANGSTALYFENIAGQLGFGISVYGSTGRNVVPFTGINGYSITEYVEVSLKVKTDGTCVGSVNDTAFTGEGLPTSGYAGFGQITAGSGTVLVKIKDLSIKAYENATPENTDCFENFDQNCFNENVFQTKSRASGLANSKLSVENKKLRFSNTGSAYMETKYKYSNVDVAFEVSDVQGETTFRQDGTVDVARSCSFGIAFGIDVVGGGMQTKAPLSVSFVPERGIHTYTVLVIKNGSEQVFRKILPNKYNMFANDGAYGVKISVRDGTVKVTIKLLSEHGYESVAEHSIGFTPLGYLQISAIGAFDSNLQKNTGVEQLQVGSFAVDNLSIKNNDTGKIVKVVDYLSNTASLVGDYEYENDWSTSDLLGSTLK